MKKYLLLLAIMFCMAGCMSYNERETAKIKGYYDLSTHYYEMAQFELKKNVARSDSLYSLAVHYRRIADSLNANLINPQ